MRKCWASELGDCDGKLTGEHIISNSILDKSIKVKGFNWCKDEFKDIGKSSLVSNFLCKKHNEELSPCDSEIKKFTDAFDTWAKNAIIFERYGFSHKKVPVTYRINGYLLENWFIKTLINVSIVNKGEVKIHFDRILPTLFSSQYLQRPYGFYLTSEVGERFDSNDFFDVTPLFNPRTQPRELTGALFVFKGFKYLILLPNSEEPLFENDRLIQISTMQSDVLRDWSRLRTTWHHKVIKEERHRFINGRASRKKYVTQQIIFEW